MPLTASNNTAQLTITSTDINGNTSINRGAGNPTLNGVFGALTINNNVAVGAGIAVATPGIVFNCYFKNNATPGSGITLQVNGTLSGGASQILCILQPGGIFLVWNVINSVAASGYTAFTFTVVGGTCPVEYFLGN